MSYTAQFGYPYHPASQLLVSGQAGSGNVGGPSPCCEAGRTVVTDPVTGQTVFACQQCDSHSLVYPRLGTSVQGSPYSPYSEQSYPPSVGIESPSFYPSLGPSYVIKEGSSEVSGWQSMAQPTGYYPYDHSITAYGYGYDINGARRKNATREATATLKAWLSEHKKNPYPTKGEKIMLAIITKMTLTQVSTWFANARRRLKKENKITWDSKGKEDDDDDDAGGKLSDSDDEKDGSLRGSPDTKMTSMGADFDSKSGIKDNMTNDGSCNPMITGSTTGGLLMPSSAATTSATASHLRLLPPGALPPPSAPSSTASMSRYGDLDAPSGHKTNMLMPPHHQQQHHNHHNHQNQNQNHQHHDPTDLSSGAGQQSRPKIWSLADTATSSCKSLPMQHQRAGSMQPATSGQDNSHHLQQQQQQQQQGWTHNSTSGSSRAASASPYGGAPIGSNARPTISRLMYGEPEHEYEHFLKNYGSWHAGHSSSANAPQATAAPSNAYAHYQQQQQQQQQQHHQQQHHHLQASASSSSHLTGGGGGQPSCELGPPATSMQGSTGGRVPASSGGGQCSGNPASSLTAAELQTDTPPQTPPNHKFPSIAGYGVAAAAATAAAAHNNGSSLGGHQVTKYGGGGTADMYGGGQRSLLSSVNSRLHDYHDDSSEAEMSNSQSLSSTGSTSQPANGAAFKPVYKSSLPNSGNLVIA